MRAMRNPAVLCLLAFVLLGAGCSGIRPQRGGSTSTIFGGAAAPTTTNTTAPENPQTPTTTTTEKTISRSYDIPQETGAGATADATSSDRQGIPRREHPETAPSSEAGPRGAPVVAQPRLMHEVVTEKATTQIGTSQDLAGILKAWGTAGAAHYKAILWALVLGVAAWRAWKREWPLIAAVLGIGAILSFLVAWWVGPVAAGAAALIWSAYHVARTQIPAP